MVFSWYYNVSTLITRARHKEVIKVKRTDRHHTLWYKKSYSKGWAKKLRDHWYCIVEIPRDTLHRKIHYEVAYIPVPRAIIIKSALEQLDLLERFGGISNKDDIERRLMVLHALFDCSEPQTADAIRKQLEVVREFKKAPK